MLIVIMLIIIMLSVVMLNVIMLSVSMLSVITLNAIILSVIMLNVVKLSVVMLSVVMPHKPYKFVANFTKLIFYLKHYKSVDVFSRTLTSGKMTILFKILIAATMQTLNRHE